MTDVAGYARLLAMLGLGVFSGTLVTRITDPLVTVLAADLGATTARVALLASAFALPFALIQPILGPVGDAIGKRRVIAIGLSLLTVFLVMSAFASSLDSLLVLRGLAGLAAGGVMPLSIAMVGDAVPMKDRQVALSRLVAFGITGQIVGGSIAGVLEPYLGWRGLMIAASFMTASAAVAIVIGGRSMPGEIPRRFDPMLAVRRYLELYRMRAARVLYGSVAVEGGLVFGCFPYFAPVLQARGLGSTTEAGLTVAAFGCGGLVFAAIAKLLLGRIGQGTMVRLGGALCLLAMCGFAFAPAAWVFIGAGLFLGTGMYMIHNTIQTRVTELSPHARGSAVALHAFHFFIGQTIGPVVYGLLLNSLGDAVALLLAGLTLLVLAMLLGRPGPRAASA